MVKLNGYTMIEMILALSITLFVFVASLSLYLRIIGGSNQLYALEVDREVKNIVTKISANQDVQSSYQTNGFEYVIEQSEQGNLTRIDITVSNSSELVVLNHSVYLNLIVE